MQPVNQESNYAADANDDLPVSFLGGGTTRPGYLFTRRLARRLDYAPQVVVEASPLLNNE